MADVLVRQDGVGAYTTLDSAVGPAGTNGNIEIQDEWTADDTTAVAWDVSGLTVTCDSDSKHPGYLIEGTTRTGSTTHYRLKDGSSNTINVTQGGGSIEDLCIIQTGDDSDEAIDYQGADVTVKNCLLWDSTGDTQKDGIYTALTGRTLTVENTIIIGFARGGIHVQQYGTASGTHTVNVDS